MIPTLPTHYTHPDSAPWLVAVPLFLTLVVVLSCVLFGRRTLLPLAQRIVLNYVQRKRGAAEVDPALIFTPPIITPTQFLAYGLISLCVIWAGLWFITPMFIALLAAPVATVGLLRLLLWTAERRYIAQLNHALPATVGRMSALLANAGGFQTVLDDLLRDMPASPLKAEWSFILDRLNMPLIGGGPATARVIVEALRAQTPSARHRTLLDHLAIALGATHDVLTLRMKAAAGALYAAEQRQSAAQTQLAQMKYSGIAIGLAGIVLTVYLILTQWERVSAAYGSSVGVFVAPIIAAALATPIVGGVLLSQTEDVDY